MYKILITGHGKFCEGIIDVFELLTGEVGVLESVALTRDLEYDEFTKKMEEKISQGEWIILADIMGGTPMKTSLEIIGKNINNSVLVAGINISLLIDIYFKIGSETNDLEKVKKIIRESIDQARESIELFDSSFIRGE